MRYIEICFCGLLLCVAISDYRTKRIPDFLVLLIAGTAFAASLAGRNTWTEMLLGSGAVSIPMIAVCMMSPGAFGGGDIKLMAAVGMYLGGWNTLESFCYGIFLGGIYALYILSVKKKSGREAFPMGPFLVGGIFLSMCIRIFFGHSILQV